MWTEHVQHPFRVLVIKKSLNAACEVDSFSVYMDFRYFEIYQIGESWTALRFRLGRLGRTVFDWSCFTDNQR